MSIKEIQKVLDLQLKTITTNTKILTPEEVGINYICKCI